MDDDELAERNYKVGVKILRNVYSDLGNNIAKLDEIIEMITYGKDGDVMRSIITKLQKSATQLNYMTSRFDELEGEVMIPMKRLYIAN